MDALPLPIEITVGARDAARVLEGTCQAIGGAWKISATELFAAVHHALVIAEPPGETLLTIHLELTWPVLRVLCTTATRSTADYLDVTGCLLAGAPA